MMPGEGDRDRLRREDVLHVARLARLSLTDEELDRYTRQLGEVIEHAADVAALELGGVAPAAHALAVANVLRPDEPSPSLDREVVLAAAPQAEEGRFGVPPIAGRES